MARSRKQQPEDNEKMEEDTQEESQIKTTGRNKRTADPSSAPDDAGAESSQSSNVSRKKAKTLKVPTAPTRASTRSTTARSSQQSAASTSSQDSAGPKTKASSSKSTKAPKPPKVTPPRRERPPPKPKAPILNTLRGPASHPRPAKSLFVIGTYAEGQLGLGPPPDDRDPEVPRPRLNPWVEEAILSGRLGEVGSGLETVAAGGMHSLLVDEQGRVYSCGVNDGGALGRITAGQADPATNAQVDNNNLESIPMIVDSLVEDGFRTVDVASGDSVSVAISETGAIRAWGSFRGGDGLLGFSGHPGAPRTQYKPVVPFGMEKIPIFSVACGTDHVVALGVDGRVHCWGDGGQGQLGRQIMERRRLNGLNPERLALRNIVHVASGNWHSFAISNTGVVYGWGLNTMGQIGVDDNSEVIKTPTVIETLHPKVLGHGRKVASISGAEHHTLFLLSDGTVYACGRGESGQLGLSDDHPEASSHKNGDKVEYKQVTKPVQVFFPPPPSKDNPDPPLKAYKEPDHSVPLEDRIVQISASMRHNLALTSEGNVYSWGYGISGELGLGPSTTEQKTPARVRSKWMNDYEVHSVHSGGNHCLILASRATGTEQVIRGG